MAMQTPAQDKTVRQPKVTEAVSQLSGMKILLVEAEEEAPESQTRPKEENK